GTGTGSFGAKTDFGTGGDGAYSVAVGDFNGDGTLDLAVANYYGHTVSILLGTGTGSFGAKTDFGTGIRPTSVAVGDFNGDGKLDLATANTDPLNGSNTVSILLGTGTGSFGAKTDFATGFLPVSVAVGDFNSDGKLDLAVGSAAVSILLNTGPIGFSLGFDSPTVTAQQGTKIRVTVNINRIGGFTGNVTVTPPDPRGINPKPPAPIATTETSVTFRLKTGGARRGRHQETFTAHDDSGRTIAATLTVIVQ
ncbi:MAG TPA: VCBS repeat-containing protein, partial [Blastocatellia bacterium]|nr:VCBS repeat-containing protein [Blastocatellia bacterium]